MIRERQKLLDDIILPDPKTWGSQEIYKYIFSETQNHNPDATADLPNDIIWPPLTNSVGK